MRNLRLSLVRLLAAVCVIMGSFAGAAAHEVRPAYLELREEKPGEFSVLFKTPMQGDARHLPYADESFDGAYLVTVLGEIPDQDAALRELRRVLKPSGRLVVGETFVGDPHVVRFGAMRERAERAGLRFDQRLGSPLGFFARFRK